MKFVKIRSINKIKKKGTIVDLECFPHHNFIVNNMVVHNCSFCCLNPEAKRMVRFRSPENVVDEIEYLIKTFPKLEEVFIQDDSFFIDNNRVIKICDEIIKRKIKINFRCSGRMKPISSEMIKKLELANFKTVMLGIESGNDEILFRCHKGINQKDIIKTFKLFRKSKITLKAFLIVGLPGENRETIIETAKFVQKLQKIKYVSFPILPNILMIYPGTEVYEIAKNKGVIDDSFWLSNKEVPFFTAKYTSKELKEFGEILTNYISYYKLKTWEGFKCQYVMIPSIIKYVTIKLIQKFINTKYLKYLISK